MRRRWRLFTAVALLFASVIFVVGTERLLRAQAAIARRRIGTPNGDDALDPARLWGKAQPGHPVMLLVLGDSVAAGLGAERAKDTFAGRLAKLLAVETQRPVRLHSAAVTGAESADLATQLADIPSKFRPDVAVIVVGGNDVTHRVPVQRSSAYLEMVVRQLRAAGSAVVVGTCPDLGALRPVPQPLRVVGSRASAQLAKAQAAVALAAGAKAVSLRDELGKQFREQPEEMFGEDQFHPSPLGYRLAAEVMLPAVVAALNEQAATP